MADAGVSVTERDLAKVSSAVQSLKEVITILAGITITITLSNLLADEQKLGMPFQRMSWKPVLFALAAIITVVRFYHGNCRHLDDACKGLSGDHRATSGLKMAVDYPVILVQSILLAALSFYIRLETYFALILLLILVIDVAWVTSVVVCKSVPDETRARVIKWLINNVVALAVVIGILMIRAKIDRPVWYPLLISTVIIANGIADFVLSGREYFPSLSAGSLQEQ